MEKQTDERDQRPGEKNKMKLKLEIPSNLRRDPNSGDNAFLSPSIENEPQGSTTPGTDEYYSTQSFMTSSPMPGATGDISSTPFGEFLGSERKSSAGQTPGDGRGIGLRALAAYNRVRWTEKEIKKKIKHRDSRLAERPGTPFPSPRALAKETPSQTTAEESQNLVSPETEENSTSPESTPCETQKQPEIPTLAITSASPALSMIPSSLEKADYFEGGSMVTTPGSCLQCAEPSPIVSDFSSVNPTSSSSDLPVSFLSDGIFRDSPSKLQRYVGQVSLLTPRSNVPTTSADSATPPSSGSMLSAGSARNPASSKDSAVSGMEEVSYVSRTSRPRSSSSQFEPLTPSSYVRPLKRATGEPACLLSEESGLGSEGSSSPGSPSGKSNVTNDIENNSTCLQLFKTLVLAIGALGTAICLSTFGPTLPAIQAKIGLSLESTSMLVSSRSTGGLIAILVLYRCFDDVTPIMSSTIALITAGVLSFVVPFVTGETALNVVLFFNGIGLAFFFCGSGALCLHIWSANYMKSIIFTQVLYSFGLILGPVLILPFLTTIGENRLVNNVSARFPLTIYEPVIMDTQNLTMTILPPSASPTSQSNTIPMNLLDYTHIYFAIGAVCCFAGLLFFIIWLISPGPTFYDRTSSFDFLKRNQTFLTCGKRAKYQLIYYSAFVMLGVALATLQLGMEATFQNLFVLYVTRDILKYGGTSGLYILTVHYGGHLVGRIIGAAVGIVIGHAPMLIFCGVGTTCAFIIQYFLYGPIEAANWICPAASGFCMGAFVPTLVRHMDVTVTISRQVAGGMLCAAYIGMIVFPVITGHLMRVYGSRSFHVVLMVLSALTFVLLIAFLFVENQLSDIIFSQSSRSKPTDIHVDPNENIINNDDSEEKGTRFHIIDDNGNVVSRKNASSIGSRRIRGEPYSMTSLVSLGSRAVIGRW